MVAPSDKVGEQGHLHEHFSQLTPPLRCVLLADGGARYWLKQCEWSADSEKVPLRACGPTLSHVRGSSKSPETPHGAGQARRPQRLGLGRTELVGEPQGSLSRVTMLTACSPALSTLTLSFAAH